ncbi:hypothetical protein D7Y21_39680, partial [Corallococcus sp. AB045]
PRRLSRRAPTPASPPASPCPEASAARRYPGNASRHVVGRTVTDELWRRIEPLLPARPEHPLGCHNPRRCLPCRVWH